MESVIRFAMDGGPVLGICNGFQVLLEAGLLPGAVRVNRGLRYLCRDVHMRVENASTVFTRLYEPGQVVRMPIGHGEGNYTAPPEALTELEYEAGVVFRYCDEAGRVTDESNPNGATAGIAGISNREGNIVGLMPHPDRCAEGLRATTSEGRVRIGRRLARAGRPRAITPISSRSTTSRPRSTSASSRSWGASPTWSSWGSSRRCGASTAPTSPRAST